MVNFECQGGIEQESYVADDVVATGSLEEL